MYGFRALLLKKKILIMPETLIVIKTVATPPISKEISSKALATLAVVDSAANSVVNLEIPVAC